MLRLCFMCFSGFALWFDDVLLRNFRENQLPGFAETLKLSSWQNLLAVMTGQERYCLHWPRDHLELSLERHAIVQRQHQTRTHCKVSYLLRKAIVFRNKERPILNLVMIREDISTR